MRLRFGIEDTWKPRAGFWFQFSSTRYFFVNASSKGFWINFFNVFKFYTLNADDTRFGVTLVELNVGSFLCTKYTAIYVK